MMLTIIMSLLLVAQVAPVTPEEEAHVKAVLKEVVAIDEELDTIRRNEGVLRKSTAARREEISSLLLRYPKLPITSDSSIEEVYSALYRHRMDRGKSVLPITQRQIDQSQQAACVALDGLMASRRELEASDDYKKVPLQQRLDLRKAFDDVLNEYGVNCTPK
jgi:hypothetical protein